MIATAAAVTRMGGMVSACSFGSDEGLIWFVMRRSLLPFRLDSRCRSKRSSLLRSGMRVLVHRSRDRRRPDLQIGKAHVCTPVTNVHLSCRLLLEKKKI